MSVHRPRLVAPGSDAPTSRRRLLSRKDRALVPGRLVLEWRRYLGLLTWHAAVNTPGEEARVDAGANSHPENSAPLAKPSRIVRKLSGRMTPRRSRK